jgi:hypothetical protein
LSTKKGIAFYYTDIKKAFPSVPYQGFIDALRVLGINENFVELIIDTQTDFFTIAKGPTGLSSRRQNLVGVHEGDCLSPTLFCLVMNMYNTWLNTLSIGYQLDAPSITGLKSITIVSSTYMDDMALIGKLANETQLMLSYFERFLRYYGMSINSEKCAYHFWEPNSTFKPTEPITGWGKVPIYGSELSYRYLGYFINISLDFSTQHKEMLKKLSKACNDVVCDHWLPLHEAIAYVDSDLVSILKYRMYVITCPQSLLGKFDARLASAVKRLSTTPRSTTTDLLLDQGLQNVYLLQSTARAQFLQYALDAPDPQCRQSSRIMHSQLIVNLSFHGFEGKSPFSQAGLAILNSALQIKRVDLSMPPLFKGVRSHLIKTCTSLQINLDHLIDLNSRDINSTLRPLAQDFLINGINDNMTFNFSSPCNLERFTNLFQSLEDSLYTELAEISRLFERQTQSNDEM